MLQYLINYDIKFLNIIRWLVDVNSLFQIELIKYSSDSGVFLVAALLVAYWLYWAYKKDDSHKEDALLIFYSIGFAFIIYMILNNFLPLRPRPETVSAIRPLVDHLPDNSFPSWHAIFAWAAVLAFFIYSRHKFYPYLVLIVSVFMLVSRILAWVHYPWDILVGFAIGFFGAWFVYYLRESDIFLGYLLPIPIKIMSLLRL